MHQNMTFNIVVIIQGITPYTEVSLMLNSVCVLRKLLQFQFVYSD